MTRVPGADHGLVNADGTSEEALPARPDTDERAAARCQRQVPDGGIEGGTSVRSGSRGREQMVHRFTLPRTAALAQPWGDDPHARLWCH